MGIENLSQPQHVSKIAINLTLKNDTKLSQIQLIGGAGEVGAGPPCSAVRPIPLYSLSSWDS